MEEGYQGYQSLSHSKWDCKYHLLFIPKKRRNALFGRARGYLGEKGGEIRKLSYFIAQISKRDSLARNLTT